MNLALLISSMMLASFNPAVLTAHAMGIATSSPIVLNSNLIPVCTCESGQGTGKPQQFNINTDAVLHGVVNSKDIGLCQINEYWNGKEAEDLGFDIYTEEGNILMANHMYEVLGFKPWSSSKACWGKRVGTSTPQTAQSEPVISVGDSRK